MESKESGVDPPPTEEDIDGEGERQTSEKRPRLDEELSSSTPVSVHSRDHRAEQAFVAASPPRFMSLDDVMKMANGVTDMSLAHELAVNDDFKLKPAEPAENSIERQVRDIVHKAFWDSLEEKMRTEPTDHSYSLKLLQDVKESLLELLLPQHTRLRQNIEEVLDLSLIEQRAEHGGVDFRYYADYVIGVMATLCAPVRDEQIAQLRQLTDIVPLYKEMCELLSLMRLDMVNFTINQLRPLVKEHSVEYERNKFKSLLATQKENGVDGLAFTRDWLSRHCSRLQSDRQPGQQQQSSSAAGPCDASATAPTAVPSLWSHTAAGSGGQGVPVQSVINSAYVELLDWDQDRVCPETVLVDARRFKELQDRTQSIALIAAVLAVTYSTVGAMLKDLADFKQTLKHHCTVIIGDKTTSREELKGLMAGMAEQASKLANDCLVERGFKPLSSVHETVLKGQISALSEPTNPIHRLMKSRVTGFVASVLAAAPGSKNVAIPPGLSALEDELSRMCESFVRLISYNYAVFGAYYRDIVKELLSAEHPAVTSVEPSK